MNKKTIIEIVISVVAFGGSAFVLYQGLHTAPPPTAGAVSTPAVSLGNILPFGDNLDFSILEKQKFQYGATQYKVLDPSQEVGVGVKDLIKPQVRNK
jgi:hypothetical protein